MAYSYRTKISLDDNHVIQENTRTLTLSGDTIIGNGGNILYHTGLTPTISGDTQLVTKKYVDEKVTGGTSSATTYNLGSPAVCAVGGIDVGDPLFGCTTNCILAQILVPEICGELTPPSMVSLTFDSVNNPSEIGVQCDFNVISTFSRGSIDPQGDSLSSFRTGLPISYCFTGAQITGVFACTNTSASKAIESYKVVEGSNTWGSCTCYSSGVTPTSNCGNPFDTAFPEGIISPGISASFTGIYPYFYGVADTTPTPGSALLAAGGTVKIVEDSNGSISINYGNNSFKYLWFATPSGSTEKQGYFIDNTKKGNIGTSSDLFGTPVLETVDSPSGTGVWGGIGYRFYITEYATNTSSVEPILMTNTPQQ